MKKVISILCMVFSFTSYGQHKHIDVFLIGGQSNATGQGYIKNIPENFKVDKSVRFFYSKWIKGGSEPMLWSPLCQASETPDKFGVELSLGTTLHQLYPKKKIAIIKHALSGSNLYKQWNPGKSKRDAVNFGQEYKKFIHTVEEGMQKLREAGYRPVIRAMVWQQGEGDARDIAGLKNSSEYGENLNHFIHRLRKQLKAKKMLFIYGYVIPVPLPRFTGRNEVRDAQKKIDQNSGDKLSVKRAFVIATDDLPLRSDELNSPHPNDVVHFNTMGILELGKRFAIKIYEETRKK